jgi:hypothetical protein
MYSVVDVTFSRVTIRSVRHPLTCQEVCGFLSRSESRGRTTAERGRRFALNQTIAEIFNELEARPGRSLCIPAQRNRIPPPQR